MSQIFWNVIYQNQRKKKKHPLSFSDTTADRDEAATVEVKRLTGAAVSHSEMFEKQIVLQGHSDHSQREVAEFHQFHHFCSTSQSLAEQSTNRTDIIN